MVKRMRNDCVTCDGTYWIMVRDEYGREFARKCPDCIGATRKIKLLSMTGREIAQTWKDVDFTKNNTRAAMKKLMRFVDSKDFLKFFLMGPNGTGKTMLAEILFYELGMKGKDCVFVSIDDMRRCCVKLGAMDMFMVDATETREWKGFREKIISADFSFVDGIGSEQPLKSFDNFLSGIIDARDRAGLKTIFTTVLDPGLDLSMQIEKNKGMKYSELTMSRLRYRADSARLCCEDMRIRKQKK